MMRTGSSNLSLAPTSRADSAKRPFWQSPPTRVCKRPVRTLVLVDVNPLHTQNSCDDGHQYSVNTKHLGTCDDGQQ